MTFLLLCYALLHTSNHVVESKLTLRPVCAGSLKVSPDSSSPSPASLPAALSVTLTVTAAAQEVQAVKLSGDAPKRSAPLRFESLRCRGKGRGVTFHGDEHSCAPLRMLTLTDSFNEGSVYGYQAPCTIGVLRHNSIELTQDSGEHLLSQGISCGHSSGTDSRAAYVDDDVTDVTLAAREVVSWALPYAPQPCTGAMFLFH